MTAAATPTIDPQPATSTPSAPSTPSRVRRWIRAHIIAPIKRTHWVFQLGDLLMLLLENAKASEKRHILLATQQQEVAKVVHDLDGGLSEFATRLAFHEQGPLRKSAVELHRRRVALAQREAAKTNGAHVDEPRSQPTKIIDASGRVIDLPQNPPPGEAATELDGEDDKP